MTKQEKVTDTTVTVNFLKQIVPEWNKISTYFVIVIISWCFFYMVTSFETPKEKEVHKQIFNIQKSQKHDDSLKIYFLNARLDRWDKKQVIDSVNNWKRDDLQLKMALKQGIDISVYEIKK